ncbi:MAG TPA: NAD(P)/FAD-dependent oxidoreductase [bacterium]|nr:NAD(P)/FAD-dependent oxidoreductase [bacterium]
MLVNQITIVGAGPAGCMAAIAAAEKGKRVLLLDRKEAIGEKLLLSGAGRCNLTNNIPSEQFCENYYNGDFLRNAFAQFSNLDLMRFLEDAGLKLVVERGQRVFPASQSAQDVVNVFRSIIEKMRIQLWLRNRVVGVEKQENGIFRISTKKGEILSKSVILATGGKSYPQTGSTGDGYRIAKLLGHTIIKPVPVLCGINLKEDWIKQWQGIALKNVSVKVMLDKEILAEEFGEAIFTHFGISGPAVLDLSRYLAGIKNYGGIKISIDFKPAVDVKTLERRLVSEFKANANKTLKNIMKNLLPVHIIEEFLLMGGLSGEIKGNQITVSQRNILLSLLKNFHLTFDSLRSFDEAIATRGGVMVKQVNPKTMESRIVPGLFFAGEILDVDGKTGGFNLQAAFSTGFVAGINA